MKIFFIVLLGFVTFFILMSIGVIFKRKPISGSCGGLNNIYQKDDGSCQICGAQVNEDCKNNVDKYSKT